MSSQPDWFTVQMMMGVARRNALDALRDPLEVAMELHGLPAPRPVRAAIPPEAVQPWPRHPPRELCEAQPARWAQLRKVRDPMPDIYEGPGAMAGYPRALGHYVEEALRDSPGDAWHYDPELPLNLIMDWPRWNKDGQRADTGEDAWDFARLVRDYERELAAGQVFPPLLVWCVDPPQDRPSAGIQWWMEIVPVWWTYKPHYMFANGRHRAAAAWRLGMRTFPAFVAGPLRELRAVSFSVGDGWMLPALQAAAERGRNAMSAAALAALGPVRVDRPQ
jgi:hypothetical protein